MIKTITIIVCTIALIIMIIVNLYVGFFIYTFISQNSNPFTLNQQSNYSTTVPVPFTLPNASGFFVVVFFTFNTTGGDLIANNPITLNTTEVFEQPENFTKVASFDIKIEDAIDSVWNR